MIQVLLGTLAREYPLTGRTAMHIRARNEMAIVARNAQ
jgi:hypothetical protein